MKTGFAIGACLASLTALSACAAGEIPIETRIANAAPAASVQARGETEPVGTTNADAADDPAIWRNADNPAASLIVGTDKKAGIYVYGLDGKVRSFLNAGAVNNVDLRAEVDMPGQPGILAAASDRNDLSQAKVALLRLDQPRLARSMLAQVRAMASASIAMPPACTPLSCSRTARSTRSPLTSPVPHRPVASFAA